MRQIRKDTRRKGTSAQPITSPGFSVGRPDLTAGGELLRDNEALLS